MTVKKLGGYHLVLLSHLLQCSQGPGEGWGARFWQRGTNASLLNEALHEMMSGRHKRTSKFFLVERLSKDWSPNIHKICQYVNYNDDCLSSVYLN